MQGVESLMVAPLYSETKLIGFIGVDNPNEKHFIHCQLLRSVASLIVNDIQKRITLEQRVINALARIYISMYLVNISGGYNRKNLTVTVMCENMSSRRSMLQNRCVPRWSI